MVCSVKAIDMYGRQDNFQYYFLDYLFTIFTQDTMVLPKQRTIAMIAMAIAVVVLVK
jgi:hypothetical protein